MPRCAEAGCREAGYDVEKGPALWREFAELSLGDCPRNGAAASAGFLSMRRVRTAAPSSQVETEPRGTLHSSFFL